MSNYTPFLKVGLLGGGQLARMLAESALRLGLEPHIYSENPSDPAAQGCRHWHQGALSDSVKLQAFIKKMDLVTFESEFIDTQKLPKKTTHTFPKPEIMAQLQDRKSQKEILDKVKMATAPWFVLDSEDQLKAALEKWKRGVVCKKRFGGYDGYGTYILKSKKQIENFLRDTYEDSLFIAEAFIPFQRECALIAARSGDGSFSSFPLVESFQKDARCFWIKGPVRTRKMDAALPKVKKLMRALDYVGVMGFEFFDTPNGLLVNELAPRVHNTGHYSQNTSGLSQFDVHWLCALKTKLPKSLVTDKGFAMVNLIGSGKTSLKLNCETSASLHWYGKEESRSGRKMGHLNTVAATPGEALKLALKAEKGFSI